MVGNQARGLLAEYGIAIPEGIRTIRRQLCDLPTSLPDTLQAVMALLHEQFQLLDEHIEGCERQLEQFFQQHEVCQHLAELPGVGLLTATAMVAQVGDVSVFQSGRHLAAYLGGVPTQLETTAEVVGYHQAGEHVPQNAPHRWGSSSIETSSPLRPSLCPMDATVVGT